MQVREREPSVVRTGGDESSGGGNVETAFARSRLDEIQRRARERRLAEAEEVRRHAPPPHAEPDREIALWNKAGRYAGLALAAAVPIVFVIAVVAALIG